MDEIIIIPDFPLMGEGVLMGAVLSDEVGVMDVSNDPAAGVAALSSR